jgi:hypothetical protein
MRHERLWPSAAVFTRKPDWGFRLPLNKVVQDVALMEELVAPIVAVVNENEKLRARSMLRHE